MGTPADLAGLEAVEAITQAVESGAGLPEVVRAASRALDASLVLIDRTSAVLAVAARSQADERSLMRDSPDVQEVELRVAEEVVGRLRMRARGEPSPAVLRLVITLVASEVERVRAPERASEEAARDFMRAALDGAIEDPGDLVARGKQLGVDLTHGATVLVARGHPNASTSADWRERMVLVAERAARAVSPGTVVAPAEDPSEMVLLVPELDEAGETGRRAAIAVMRELEASLPAFRFALGRSRAARGPAELHRAGYEALLAANVVEGDEEHTMLSSEETGAYRLLLSVMMEDVAELQRFYAETVEPLVAYDDQYETDFVGTLEAFLDCDANVNATAARLFTHRHTVKYRFDRVRDLTGLDVRMSDGRERLSLGLKAMRVLGIVHPRGPATEPGA
ncbi:MAG: putative transcriptional regulator, PucR family, partial [Solirubrobacterales bacterium]|nr:putative transcriptional regulator, PucR family [Solirubrobacterales bacterium]